MATYPAVYEEKLPTVFSVTEYIPTQGTGIYLGVFTKLGATGGGPPSVPTTGQIWPRGNRT